MIKMMNHTKTGKVLFSVVKEEMSPIQSTDTFYLDIINVYRWSNKKRRSSDKSEI